MTHAYSPYQTLSLLPVLARPTEPSTQRLEPTEKSLIDTDRSSVGRRVGNVLYNEVSITNRNENSTNFCFLLRNLLPHYTTLMLTESQGTKVEGLDLQKPRVKRVQIWTIYAGQQIVPCIQNPEKKHTIRLSGHISQICLKQRYYAIVTEPPLTIVMGA